MTSLDEVRAAMDLLDEMEDLVLDQWARTWGGGFPERADIRTMLRRLPINRMLEAMDITASRFPGWANRRYFFGVCWRMIEQEEHQ